MPTNAINDTGVKYLYDKLHGEIEPIAEAVSDSEVTIEGNPLSFNTLSSQNAKSTILSVEPIQDLHGYDKPWTGGAGKNKLPLTVDGIKSANTNGTWSGNVYNYNGVDWTILTDSDNNVIGIKANGSANPESQLYIARNFTLSAEMTVNGSYQTSCMCECKVGSTYYSDIGSYPRNPPSGTAEYLRCLVRNNTSASNYVLYPMLRLSTESDATFQPYTNIASITGRTEIGILGCGKNLLPNGIEYSNLQHEYFKTTNDILLNAGTYTASFFNDNTSDTRFFVNKVVNGQEVNLKVITVTSKTRGYTDFTINSAEYIRLNGRLDPTATISDLSIFKDFQIELGSIATEYEPYQESTDLTISLGQTVYGGTLDVENGVLVVDRGYVEYDGSIDETWTANQSFPNTYYTDKPSGFVSDDTHKPISNQYLLRATLVYEDTGLAIGGKLNIKDNFHATSLEDWKTYLSNNPVQICYYIETPITVNLTPNTISLLKGVNNISTDGDKITLTYRNGKFATLDGAVPKMTFRGEDYTMGIDDIGLFLKNLTKSTKTYIADPLLNFDGTVATYKKIMKQWFINNGVNVMDSTGITYLCERWYEITKQGWKGGTSFPAVGVSTGSTGTRFDDNVDMSVTPSTDTSANTDTYQGLPLFAITDCNWELDSDGNILITAIDGITDNFVRDDPTKFVGVMQQTGWVKKVDDAFTQKYYYADDKDAYEDLVPLPEAIKLDGTVRSFVCHSKYMSGIVDSKMTCCSGVIPRRNISHDGLVTLPDNIGTQYSGGTSVDWSFLVWMQRIKYASLTSDGVLQGCCNYNYQYYVKVSETGVKRLILSSANGANLKVGSTVTFGAYAGNADRGQAATYSISGQDGAIITAIEDVTIDGTTYKAVYVDTASTFDTVANGDATNGTTIVSTHHWVSGSCDNVKGNDGSPVSATNGVYPARLQGIEYMVGGYEVFADVIMNISGGYYNPYYARKSTEQATSITSSMVQSTLKCAQPSSDAWRYIQKHGFDGEIFYPILTGTSSSEYTKDGFYENGTSTSTGTREWLAFGYLGFGSGNAGLSFLLGNHALSAGWWLCVARLSCNGNRGILLTA